MARLVWLLENQALGAALSLLCFHTAIGVLAEGAVWPGLAAVYSHAWFVGFLASSGVYWLLMRRQVADQSPGRVVVRPASNQWKKLSSPETTIQPVHKPEICSS